MDNLKTNIVDDILDALETAKEAYKLLPPAPSNMKPVHFRVLNAIYRSRGDNNCLRISDISRTLGFKLPNTTKFINELVELNIVEKFNMPSDKRVVLVRTTEEGEKYLQECVLTFRMNLQKEFCSLSESDCITMIKTIHEVHHLLKKSINVKSR